jgi:hypothetical protein
MQEGTAVCMAAYWLYLCSGGRSVSVAVLMPI